MNQVVYKYVLNSGRNWIQLPRGAEVLCCRERCERITLWALVDPAAELEERVFDVVPTGHQFTRSEGEALTYLGTCLFLNGEFVLHAFEVRAKGGPE